MEKEKAWFETVIPNPDPKAHGKAMKILGYNDKGLETIVRKAKWVIVKCDFCDTMSTAELHTCPKAQDLEGDDTEICNCCHECVQHCMDDI